MSITIHLNKIILYRHIVYRVRKVVSHAVMPYAHTSCTYFPRGRFALSSQ